MARWLPTLLLLLMIIITLGPERNGWHFQMSALAWMEFIVLWFKFRRGLFQSVHRKWWPISYTPCGVTRPLYYFQHTRKGHQIYVVHFALYLPRACVDSFSIHSSFQIHAQSSFPYFQSKLILNSMEIGSANHSLDKIIIKTAMAHQRHHVGSDYPRPPKLQKRVVLL